MIKRRYEGGNAAYRGIFYSMKQIALEDLLQAGCHFGHKAEKWDPKMEEYIYTVKDGIHIIDLAKTKQSLEEAREAVKQFAMEGHEILFVGTKRQAKSVVKEYAQKAGAPYLIERWIGGFLTNWESIRQNVAKANRMQQEKDANEWQKFPKHEQVRLTKHLERLKATYEGVLKLGNLPRAICITDAKKEDAAIKEAKRIGVTVIAIVDTNVNPSLVDYPIPANDDAIGSITYIIDALTEAYREGKEQQEKEEQKEKIKTQPKEETKKTKQKKQTKKQEEQQDEEGAA